MGHSGLARPVYRTEPHKAFAIFILVCIMLHPVFNLPLDSPSAQNRYLPMVYAIWLVVCTCPERCLRPTHSNRSIAANESWSYTYEVGSYIFLRISCPV